MKIEAAKVGKNPKINTLVIEEAQPAY